MRFRNSSFINFHRIDQIHSIETLLRVLGLETIPNKFLEKRLFYWSIAFNRLQ